jgi:flagellar assembly protein FliH
MTGKIIKGGESKGQAQGPHARRPADVLPDAGGIVHRRVMDASKEAERILRGAEVEAARVREEAKRALADAQARAKQEVRRGYAQGEAKGLAQVTEKLVAFEKLRERFYGEAEPQVIKLVMAIAEKVIGRLVQEQADAVRSIVKQALEKSLGDRIVVRMNPEDYGRLMEGEHEFREVVDRTKRLAFREDDAIARGGCIVETEVGTIDAQIETQLAAIKKALTT